MTKETISIIGKELESLGLNYHFMKYKAEEIVYPYFIGEYEETPPYSEDGMNESTFIITGYSRATVLELEEVKELIKNEFNEEKLIKSSKGVIAVVYESGGPIPTADFGLNKIQINLNVKEWKGRS